MGGEGGSVTSGECDFSSRMLKLPRTTCAISCKAAEKGIHVIVKVEGTWWTVGHHNVELDRKGDSDGVEFKCRSGLVFQWKDLVGPIWRSWRGRVLWSDPSLCKGQEVES